jgi:hypothetical protein
MNNYISKRDICVARNPLPFDKLIEMVEDIADKHVGDVPQPSFEWLL